MDIVIVGSQRTPVTDLDDFLCGYQADEGIIPEPKKEPNPLVTLVEF